MNRLPSRGRSPLRSLLVAAAIGIAAAHASPAAAQDLEPLAELGVRIPTSPSNAATWYVRAIDELSKVDPRDRDIVANWDYRTPPTRSLRVALRAHEAVLEDVAAGASRTRCDFELGYEQGWELLLPHLGPMRAIARALRARALVAIHTGRSAAAVRDVERILRMGWHISNDEIVISSLVSIAIVAMADDVIDTGFRRGVFGPAEAATLLDITQELATPGAFRLREALAMERRITDGWLRQTLVDATPAQRLEFFEDVMGGAPDGEDRERILEATPEEVSGQIDGLGDAYREVEAVFAAAEEDPDAAAGMVQAFEERLIEGEFGELALNFMPALGRLAQREQRLRENLAAREAMLRGVIAGDPAARGLDAAIHVREAMRAAAMIPDAAADLIAMGAGVLAAEGDADGGAEPEAGLTVEPDAVRAALATVLEQLTAAAAADHFDATVLHAEGDSIVIPSWAGPVRRVMGLLAGEATRHLDAGEHAEALRLVTVGLRVSRHLASSGTIAASLVVQEHLERLVPLVRGLPDELRADDAPWSSLVAASEAIVTQPRRDEERGELMHREDALLGYWNAVMRLQSIAGQAAGDLRARMAGKTTDWGGPIDEANALDGDMAVMLVLATERVAGAVYEPAAPPAASAMEAADGEAEAEGDASHADRLPRVPGLDGIVDAAELLALEQRVAAIRRAIVDEQEPLAAIAGPEPSPLNVRARQRDARRLIRELHRAVDPTREDEPEPDDASSDPA
jgi:hypothetical protein